MEREKRIRQIVASLQFNEATIRELLRDEDVSGYCDLASAQANLACSIPSLLRAANECHEKEKG